jgi:hypothetical protein
MANIYSPDSTKLLSHFIDEIKDINSNIVIPDLQRPYVWNPSQVILLIDSIFKKWPFGSLLCWDVKASRNKSDFIPNRPFWEIVVRDIKEKEPKQASYNKSSDSFLMILDGQQRMQSLLIALAGDSWGFLLPDRDWKKDIDRVETSMDIRYWSVGCLCLNVEKFLNEYDKCNCKIYDIEIGKCLSWAVTDINTGLSYNNKNPVLPVTNLIDGKYLRFSKIWRTAKSGIKMPKDYEAILKESFSEISDEILDFFINPLSEFMTVVADVKNNTYITRLVINNYENSGIDSRSLYNNAIVNIFARLNTAGRALTPQEITLAWLKTGWREASGNDARFKDCANELEILLDEINDNNNLSGMQMTMDNLVDILSLIWTILSKDGNNKNDLLLNDKDLVNGDIIKSIGTTTYEQWDIIKKQ